VVVGWSDPPSGSTVIPAPAAGDAFPLEEVVQGTILALD
jgi:hypothetical protein